MAKNSTFKERTKKNQNDLKKDIKSKTVLDNPLLCCQFLRNYVNHPKMKNIRQEDIED